VLEQVVHERAAMLLAMDVGNTQAKVGLFQGDALRGRWRLSTASRPTSDELVLRLQALLSSVGTPTAMLEGCCIASVAPALDRELESAAQRLCDRPPMFVHAGLTTGLTWNIPHPERVGADRVANAVAAHAAGAAFAVDFGTATKIEALKGADYCGGAIAPGLGICAEVLFEKGAKLPLAPLQAPECAVGVDTIGCMQSGLVRGHAAMVQGLVEQMAEETGADAVAVAAGGYAAVLAPLCPCVDRVEADLTLHGVRMVYDLNIKDVA
jgi:type III pantothenate kinase